MSGVFAGVFLMNCVFCKNLCVAFQTTLLTLSLSLSLSLPPSLPPDQSSELSEALKSSQLELANTLTELTTLKTHHTTIQVCQTHTLTHTHTHSLTLTHSLAHT